MLHSLSIELVYLFCFCLFTVSVLYASIGHGGASGYLAVFILFGFEMADIKAQVLLMNCFVAFISFALFFKEKKIAWHLFFPFAIPSIPCSFIGAYIKVDLFIYKILLGVFLLFSIAYILISLSKKESKKKEINLPLAIFLGAMIGLASGMIGIGGGVLLSPLLLIFGWASIAEIASICALFIFVNSVSGIFGHLFKGNEISFSHVYFVPIVVFGGFLGAYLGSKHYRANGLKFGLCLVLLLACYKCFFDL